MENKVLIFRIITDKNNGQHPYILLASVQDLQTSSYDLFDKLRLEHTHILTNERVKTASLSQIKNFIIDTISNANCDKVVIKESVTFYLKTL